MLRTPGLSEGHSKDDISTPSQLFANRTVSTKEIGIIVATWDIYFNEIMSEIIGDGFDTSNIYFLCGFNKRTISHKMTPKNINNISVEVSLAEHCNLNCQMCDHFSPLAAPAFLCVDSYKSDMERLAKLTNGQIGLIKLLGGEPLLNEHLLEFLKITREYFHQAEIWLITNGLMLKSWENHPSGNLWKVCQELDVKIELTVYPIALDLEGILELANEYRVQIDLFTEISDRMAESEKRLVKHPLDLKGNVEKWQFIGCYQFNECLTLKAGKLYTCPIIPCIEHFNSSFNQNLPVSENDYIDIYQAQSFDEIAEFLTHRTSFCRFCRVNERSSHPWKQSERVISEYI